MFSRTRLVSHLLRYRYARLHGLCTGSDPVESGSETLTNPVSMKPGHPLSSPRETSNQTLCLSDLNGRAQIDDYASYISEVEVQMIIRNDEL